MAIAENVKKALSGSSMIRKMFEEGLNLKKQYGEDKVFDFSLGNPDLDPPKAFHDTLVRLAEEDKKGSHGYMPNAGFPYVRDAIAKKVSREHDVDIDGSHIVMAAGAAGALNTVFKAICNPGDEIIVPSPFFMEYRAYAANHHIKLVEVPAHEDFNLDLDGIGKAINGKTAAILINSPNNPTGNVYSASDLSRLSFLMETYIIKTDRVMYLISDEPYRDIAYGLKVPPLLCCYRESIVVSSYSKNLSLPGERIGYIAVNPMISAKEELVNALIYCTRALGFVNAPALMQRIVAELTETHVDVEIYARRRDAFMKVLDCAGIEYAVPKGAFYLFCKVPERKGTGGAATLHRGQGTDADFAEHLKKHLILGVPGSAFGKGGWVRFAYCVDEKIILSSADAFKAAMDEW